MIVLLSCSINSLANSYQYSSTGEQEQNDSVYIAYNDLRIVNSKLIELKYEKEINKNLRSIVRNDSIIIDTLTIENKQLKDDIYTIDKKATSFKKQRSILIGCCLAILTSTIVISLIK